MCVPCFHKNRNKQTKIIKVFVYEKTNPKPASYSTATPGSDSRLNETRLADSVPALTVQGASVLARETWLLGAARGPPFLRHCLLGSMFPSRQELQMDFGPARRTLSPAGARTFWS